MSKRKKEAPDPARRSSEKKPQVHAFYTPFSALGQHLPGSLPTNRAKKSRQDDRVPPRVPEAPRIPDESEENERIFREAMTGVVPIHRAEQERVPPAVPVTTPARFLRQEELESLAYLEDLVSGDIPFELVYSDEYVDGAVVGLSPKILKKLRNGDFSYQEYIDLHGYTREEGRAVVIDFVKESFARNLRCILIISGRGLNSRDKEPVLKQGLVSWLIRAPLKRIVLAFASARSYDGGSGAFYILLRRNKGNAPLVTPAG
jgi:DNA-nicking Smr family endonuclease